LWVRYPCIASVSMGEAALYRVRQHGEGFLISEVPLYVQLAVGQDGIRHFKEKALVSYVFYSEGVFAGFICIRTKARFSYGYVTKSDRLSAKWFLYEYV